MVFCFKLEFVSLLDVYSIELDLMNHVKWFKFLR